MFFILSKVFWLAMAPSSVLVGALIVGCVLARLGYRPGWRLVAAATTALGICGLLPLGTLMLRPLEDRFSVPDLDGLQPSGIIVLGGAIDQVVGPARGQLTVPNAATRLIQGATLARRFPQARLLYTGGSNALIEQVTGEAEEAKRLWVELGIDPARIITEDRSRNTFENAQFSRDLLHPGQGDRWLLVTSAYHMPRSVGLFRAAGVPVIPFPVDYQTTGNWRDFQPNRTISAGLATFDFAAREWIGLLAYRLSGKTAQVLPGP